jgi:hypothetical protein
MITGIVWFIAGVIVGWFARRMWAPRHPAFITVSGGTVHLTDGTRQEVQPAQIVLAEVQEAGFAERLSQLLRRQP